MGRLGTARAGRRAWAAMVVGSLALSGILLSAGPAAAGEVSARPADGVFVLDDSYAAACSSQQPSARGPRCPNCQSKVSEPASRQQAWGLSGVARPPTREGDER